MGLKGISWIEQNVEKVVVGVFGVAMLGVVAYQFVGEGNGVELGTGANKRSYPYDQVWDQVAQQARTTKAKITSIEANGEAVGYTDAPSVLSDFTSKIQGNVSPTKQLAAFDRPSLERLRIIDLEGGAQRLATETYVAFAPPAAGKPVASAHLGTIHPEEVRMHADLAKLVGANPAELETGKLGTVLPKLDRAAVSVETLYDGTVLENMLLSDPDGDGPASPMPRHWWDSDRVQIVGVELERQELNAQGEWTSPVKVAHMPGRLDLVKAMGELGAAPAPGQTQGPTYADIVQEAGRQRDMVQRQPYYSLLLGEDWVAPSEAGDEVVAAETGGDEKGRGKKQLTDIDSEIIRLQERRKKLEEEMRGPSDGGRPQPPPPQRGGGGRMGPGRNQSDRQTVDPKQAQLNSIDQNISRLFTRRQSLIERYRKAGIELETTQDQATAPVTPTNPSTAPVATSFLKDSALRLWAHDVTVERGKTYRYRMTLVLNNPIYVYGKTAALDSSQAEVAKSPVVRSAPSVWSDEVRVDPDTFYFITGASPEDAFASTARASAEVFVFSMGYWRKGQVNLEPGDTIAAEVRVPDAQKLGELIVMGPSQQQPQQPSYPGRQPAPAGPDNWKPGDPMPNKRGLRPDQSPGTNTPGYPPSVVPTMPVLQQPGIDLTAIMVPKLVEENAMLLDVATTTVVSDQQISKTKTENQAFLLEEDGAIVVRTPEGDRSMQAYQRLLRSVERGSEALKPKTAGPMIDPSGIPRAPDTAPQPENARPRTGGG